MMNKQFIGFISCTIFFIYFVFWLADKPIEIPVKEPEQIKMNFSKFIPDKKVKEIVKEIDYEKIFDEYISLKNSRVKSWVKKSIIKNTIEISKEIDIHPMIIMAVINVESSFNFKATVYRWGIAFAYGLMQVRPDIWIDKVHSKNLVTNDILNTQDDLYNIALNIKAGTFILNENKRICKIWKDRDEFEDRGYYNNLDCVVSRYNGAGKSKKYYNKILTSLGELYYIKNGII